MRKTFAVLVITLLLAAGAAAVFADMPEVYVRNQALKDVLSIQGKLYGNAGELLKLMGYGWSLDGKVLTLTSGKSGGPAIPGTEGLTFSSEGKTFSAGQKAAKGNLYVDLKTICKSLGYVYNFNESSGIVDISSPGKYSEKVYEQALAQAQADAKAQAARAAEAASKPADQTGGTVAQAGGTGGTGGKKQDEPIQTKVDFFSDYNTGETRGTASVINTASREVKNVVAALHMQDNNGNDITVIKTWNIGNMAAGQTFQESFYWNNPSKLVVKAVVTVEHQPLEEPKAKVSTTPGGTVANPTKSDTP